MIKINIPDSCRYAQVLTCKTELSKLVANCTPGDAKNLAFALIANEPGTYGCDSKIKIRKLLIVEGPIILWYEMVFFYQVFKDEEINFMPY